MAGRLWWVRCQRQAANRGAYPLPLAARDVRAALSVVIIAFFADLVRIVSKATRLRTVLPTLVKDIVSGVIVLLDDALAQGG